MKRGKVIFSMLIFGFLALTVLGKNNLNLGIDFLSFGDRDNEVSEKEIQEYVDKHLKAPVLKCYMEANPHAFMSKCTSEFLFRIDRPSWADADYKPVYYTNQTLYGNLVFIDCEVERHIGKVKVNITEDLIMVQESFFSNWIHAKEFNKSFCERSAQTSSEE